MALLLLAVSVVAVAASWWLAGQPVLRLVRLAGAGTAGPAPTVEEVLLGGCGVALLGCAVWLVGAVTVAAASFLVARRSPAGAASRRWAQVAEAACPAAVRRLVAVLLGAALSAGVGAAHADPEHLGPPSAARASPTRLQEDLRGLALPDRVSAAGIRSVAPAVVLRPQRPQHSTEQPAAVTVRPGDSLWSIAARLLAPGTTDARVAQAWHRLAAHNADRLGPDPDLIHPGTRLRVPDLTTRP